MEEWWTITGPEFCLIDQVLGVSGFYLGGKGLDAKYGAKLPPNNVAVKRLINRKFASLRPDGMVLFDHAKCSAAHSSILRTTERGLLRKLLEHLVAAASGVGTMVNPDGINGELLIDASCFAPYDALIKMGLISKHPDFQKSSGVNFLITVTEEARKLIGGDRAGNSRVPEDDPAKVKVPDLTDPATLIYTAARHVPVVWWFVAVAAVLATVFIVSRYQISLGALVLGGVGLLIGVIALVIATALVQFAETPDGQAVLSFPAKVLMWAFLLLIILSGAFTFTSFFFNFPIPLGVRSSVQVRDVVSPSTIQSVSDDGRGGSGITKTNDSDGVHVKVAYVRQTDASRDAIGRADSQPTRVPTRAEVPVGRATRSVTVYWGSWVSGVEFKDEEGDVYLIGMKEGQNTTIALATGEVIVSIRGIVSNEVDRMEIITSGGQILGPCGAKDFEIAQRDGHHSFTLTAPIGGKIVGLTGSKHNVLNGFQLIVEKPTN